MMVSGKGEAEGRETQGEVVLEVVMVVVVVVEVQRKH